jgi:hypothetical protein
MNARTHHRFRLAAATLAVAALSAPVGAAAANEGNALLRNDKAHFGNATTPATTSTRSNPVAPAVVVRVDEGFDWVSAGVGAAGGFGALLLAAGAGSALRRRTDTAAAGGR